MSQYKIKRAPRIEAEIQVPGDKSISHRAILLGAISNGTCKITNFLEGEDCQSTIKAMTALGVKIETPEPGTVIVHGNRGRFTQPEETIDCGNSGTTMRLLSGILSAQPIKTRLSGDESLSRRPMKRVMTPLRQMGARLSTEGSNDTPPLIIEGGELQGITYESPVASAQVKSAILLAGLFASGRTTVIEPAPSRDHTERMLEYFLVPVRRDGNKITISGNQRPESRDFAVPGDISSAAFWMVAAAAQPGARLLIKDVGLNPTRTGIIDVLVRMGARIREVVEEVGQAEPRGTVDIKGAKLRGTIVEGAEIPNVIDEIPAIAIAGALAEGETIIRDAAELRVKETDRIAAVAENLQRMGVPVEVFADGMKITGGAKLKGAEIQSYGDHRIAMAFAIAGLFAAGETVIHNVECVATSYPGFEKMLQSVQKGTGIFHRTTPVISRLAVRPD